MADISTIGNRIGLPDHMKIIRVADEKAYTVLVNPTSYSVNYQECYVNDQEIGAVKQDYYFNKSKSQTMNISLLFDATGSFGKIPFIDKATVLEQIEEFLSLIYVKNEEGHQYGEANKLKLVWGPMLFEGVLDSLNISYSLFDNTGAPIRAEATCKFKGGDLKLKREEVKKPKKNGKVKDLNKQKHAINAIQKHASYVAVVTLQPESALPKSLRIASEVAKLILS